jgi:hypothetical protein
MNYCLLSGVCASLASFFQSRLVGVGERGGDRTGGRKNAFDRARREEPVSEMRSFVISPRMM